MKRLILLSLWCFGLTIIGISQTTYISAGSGNWNTGNTWTPNGVPGANDNAVVSANHTVSVKRAESVKNLTVSSSGILTSNSSLSVSGDVVINGTYGGDGAISLTGNGTTISGTGIISNTATITVTNNKTILAVTDLIINSSNLAINGAFTIANNGTITVGGNITGTVSGSTWTNTANATLNIGGTLLPTSFGPPVTDGTLNSFAPGNTINYYAGGPLTLKLPSLVSGYSTYYNLIVSGSGTKTVPNGNVAVEGNLTINGTLGGSGSLKKLFLRGNWINNGAFTEGAGQGTVTFDGTGNQSIIKTVGSVENFNVLVVNKSSGLLSLNTNVIVETELSMTAGIVDAGTLKVTLGLSTSAPGTLTYTTGRIIGKFERWINSTSTSIEYPIGTSGFFRPVSIYFNNLISGSLITEFISNAPGNNGLLPLGTIAESGVTIFNTFRDGYWSLTTPNTLASNNFNLDLTGNGFSGFTINDNTRILTRAVSGDPWILNGSHVARNGATIKRNNVSILSGEYCFGDDTNCVAPAASAITGSTNLCKDAAGQVYSLVNPTSGNTYTWNITGGTFSPSGLTSIAGVNLTSATVNWGSTGMIGSITVLESNSCTQGALLSLSVNVHPIPPIAITGKLNVPQLGVPETYSVPAQAGYIFTWAVTGGSILSGQGTRTVQINWGSAGPGTLSVVANNTSCGFSSTPISINVNIYLTIFTTGAGPNTNWSTAANWSCTCVPPNGSNVTIRNTHTISMSGGTARSPNNLNIDAGGTLVTNSNPLTVSGDFAVNGTLSGAGLITLTGANNYIDGIGNITNTNSLILTTNKKVASTSDLKKATGSVNLSAGITVTNEGGIVTLGGDLTGADAFSTWNNADNSTLNIAGVLLLTGRLVASAKGNNINYTGAIDQSIKTPQLSQYYDLTLSGSGTKTPGGTLFLSGDFADLTNNSGVSTFNANTGTIEFNGTASSITNTNPVSFYNLTVAPLSSLTSSAGTINVLNNFTNNGNFNHNNGTVTFNGVTPSLITGATALTTFNNIASGNPAGVSVERNLNLLGVLTVNSGAFDADGSANTSLFTLKSFNDRPTQDASIGIIGAGGSVVGNVTAERYISGQGLINRYISSPLANVSVAQLQDDFFVTGPFAGSSFPCTGCKTNNSSLRYYDESVTGTFEKGYKPYPAPSGNNTAVLTAGRGHLAWMYQNVNLTWDMTGTVNQGTISLPVTYNSSSAGINHDGWNLVGNPYPSSIKWGGSSDWIRTNIDPVISVPDLSITTGYPNYYHNYNWVDDSGDPAAGIIAMGQAFWVKANAATPILSVRETAKTGSGSGNFYRVSSPSEQLVIAINNGKYEDKSYLKLNPAATMDYDPLLDGYKFKNEFMNIYLMDNAQRNLVMHTLPDLDDDTQIPIGIEVNKAGNYAIRFSNMDNFRYGTSLYLIDSHEGVAMPVTSSLNYTFDVYDYSKPVADRFYLSLSDKIEQKDDDMVFVYPNPVKEFLYMRTPHSEGEVTTTLFDSNGKSMVTSDWKGESNVDMRNYPSGMYIFRAKTSQGVIVKKIVKNN